MKFELGREQLRIIRSIFAEAEEDNKFIFIKGGWNIDLSYGSQTRKHKDIDFHYDLKDRKFWENFFEEKGFKEEKDGWSSIFTNSDGIVVDFEGVSVSGEILTWNHGGSSKSQDVFEDKDYSGLRFKGMKLNVEKYLKLKSAKEGKQLREKDKHDLALMEEVDKIKS